MYGNRKGLAQQYNLKKSPSKCAQNHMVIIKIYIHGHQQTILRGPYSILLKAGNSKPSDLQKEVLSSH